MKANSPQSQPTSAQKDASQAPAEEWNTSDPVWKLLDQASEPKEDVFFARNVLRTTRNLEQTNPSIGARLAGFFSAPRLALGAAACGCALLVWQMMPSADPQQDSGSLTTNDPIANPVAPNNGSADVTDLSDLVMIETLSAAAEDPTIFTRDEVVGMLGL